MKILFRRVVAGVGLIAVTAVGALAQTTPPDMPAIAFPVSTTSIVTTIVAAGAIVLLAYFGPRVAFGFAKKIMSRLTKSV